ncbi:MAG TPA: ATP-binding cassette domain-containing protein [Trueperaceae bacterium]|nr:ATP-binding cassette domain-containing protein [Trueperaceae bacterium]
MAAGGPVRGAAGESARGAGGELLRVERLTRNFGGFTAVSDLSFHVTEGEVLGLVGPNGAGKTTTFNLVTGFLKPTSGRVRFRGEDVTGWAPHRLARRGLVRTFQHTRVFADLSVEQNVRVASHMREPGGPLRTLFGAGRLERAALAEHVAAVLETVGLAERRHDVASGLAYGEQRVLEIALALAASPRLLLLDEPFAGMNETESSRTMDLIHAVRDAGATVLVIDHHMQTMARGCDRLVVVDYGVKLAEGDPEAVTNDPLVIEAYMGASEELRAPVVSPADAAADVLVLNGVGVSYGRVRALGGVDLNVREGEIVALVGANGAGKTTALRAVSGLLPVDKGDIALFGRSVSGLSSAARVRLGMAHCPEGREIFPRMSVRENLEMGVPDGPVDESVLDHVYQLFPRLRERSGQSAGSLSGGEQQMLAIGRALMSSPRLLLLDEPTLGLAPLLAQEVGEALLRLNEEGVSVLLVEQNAVLALAIAHRAYVLENGEVALSGPAAELREDAAVRKVYLGA